jgi:hypothetical protein
MSTAVFHVTRAQFLDRDLSIADLRDAVEMWRGWHRLAQSQSVTQTHKPTRCVYRLQVEIYGFPRHEGEILRQEAAAALGDLIDAESVQFKDPDTLIVAGPLAGSLQPVAIGIWVRLIGMDRVKGLCVTLRVTTANESPARGSDPDDINSLVLFGVPKSRSFLLKALWHAQTSAVMEKVQRGAPDNADERKLVNALDAFWRVRRQLANDPTHVKIAEIATPHRLECDMPQQAQRTSELIRALTGSPESAWIIDRTVSAYADEILFAQAFSYGACDGNPAEFFVSRNVERHANRIVRLLYELPGDRGLKPFLARLAVPLAALLSAAALIVTPRDRFDGRFIGGVIGVLGIIVLLRILWVKAKLIVRYHNAMNRALGKLYDGDVECRETSFLADGLAEDPHVRKFTAEWEQLGARACVEFHMITSAPQAARSRHFVLDDNISVTVSFMWAAGKHQNFPTIVVTNIVTYFADGTRLVTINSGGGYKKPIFLHLQVTRLVSMVTDPREIIDRHRKVLRRLCAEGRIPVSIDPGNKFIQIREDHERSKEAYRARGKIYLWSDAFHEGFAIPRRVYFEPDS